MKEIKKILALSLAAVLTFTGVDLTARADELEDIMLEILPEEETDVPEEGGSDASLILSDSDEEIEISLKASDDFITSEDTGDPDISIESIEIVDSVDLDALSDLNETNQNDEIYHIEYKEQVDVDSSLLSDNDELQEEYIRRLFDLSGIQTYAEHGRKYLSGNSLIIYNRLRDWIESIAAGTEISSSIIFTDLNIRYTYEEMGLTRSATADEVLEAFKDLFHNEINYNLILYYLIVDCPYDLYWYNKASSCTFGFNIDIKAGNYAETSEVLAMFPVSSDYQGNSTYELDTEKTSVANNAAENAQAIVAKHAGEADLERMESYKDEICDLVTYNYDAASDIYAYGDPWQLVYVFDEDDSTNVVCEGYSKAFQYLCDLDGGEEVCYLVTGTMTGNTSGSHMWNILKLDGIRYLVDVTNSDSGSVGENGGLFMVTASDAASTGEDAYGYPIYTFKVDNTNVKYSYDDETIETFPLSALTLGTIDPIDISSVAINLSENDFIYDGESKEPALTVTYGNENLFEQEDYSAPVYDNNIDAGTATVTIYGIGDYSGEASAEFTIEKADQTVEVSMPERTLTVGDAISISASGIGDITYDSSDSSIVTVDNGVIIAVSVGTATITATASGDENHNAGRAAVEITITALNLAESEYRIELSESRYTYDGEAKEPDVTLIVGSEVLAEGADYIVDYTNNVSAGTGTVTVTGEGNYTGTVTAEFEIEAADISDAVVTVSDVIYSGEALTPEMTVSVGSEVLANGTDYLITYDDNVSAGTATVTLTGQGNYTGEKTVEFTIEAANIVDAQVTLSENSYTYDGESKAPDVTVITQDGNVLVEDTDYTVEYENNIEIGTATVTITGIGNYTGTATVDFEIEKEQTATEEQTDSDTTGGNTKDGGTADGDHTGSSMADDDMSGSDTTDGGTTDSGTTGGDTTDGGSTDSNNSDSNTTDNDSTDSGMTGGGNTASGNISSNTTDSGNTGKSTAESSNTGSNTTNGTTDSSAKSDSTSDLKKGGKYTVGNFVYKITKLPASGMGTVSVTGPSKSSIKKATIPAKVTIGNRSFKVTKIAAKSFSGCTKLKTVTIGKNVATIGNQAFANCTKMTAVTIKTGTTKIGKKAFYNCKKLKTITIKSKKLATVGKNAFKGIKSNATIIVPKSKYRSYANLLAGKGQGTKVKITK